MKSLEIYKFIVLFFVEVKGGFWYKFNSKISEIYKIYAQICSEKFSLEISARHKSAQISVRKALK